MSNTIHNEFEEDRKMIQEKSNRLLEKFQWENFKLLVEKYLNYYYKKHLVINPLNIWLVSINEFKYWILIPQLIEFYYLFSLDPSNFDDNEQTNIILRSEYLNILYSELIYDWEETNPYINWDLAGSNPQDWFVAKNYTNEWIKYRNECKTKFNLIEILSQS